jgi:hypothetical protein
MVNLVNRILCFGKLRLSTSVYSTLRVFEGVRSRGKAHSGEISHLLQENESILDAVPEKNSLSFLFLRSF